MRRRLVEEVKSVKRVKNVKRVKSGKRVKNFKSVVMVVVVVVVGLGGYGKATGHACLALPSGRDKNGNHLNISLIGNLYYEDILCEAGYLFQDKTQIFSKKPDFFRK
ncbi:MAG: hypothetical protein NTV01_05195 [Bacteroidia bacterium]|nr:hypothetical protein [Bacteroidia bacterium]